MSLPNFIEALRSEDGNWRGPRYARNAVDGQHTVVTYSFMSSVPAGMSDSVAGGNPNTTFEPFTATLKELARQALEAWSSVSGLSFVEISASDELAGKHGMIEFGRYAMTEASGWATIPQWINGQANGGWVFIDVKRTGGPGVLFPPLQHEIGHSLGFKHPWEGSHTLSPAEQERSVMVTGGSVDIFDIAAVQELYGVNDSARAGNDVYLFGDQPYVWDGNGTDTISALSASQGVHLNLQPGSWSFEGSRRSASILDPGQLFIGFGTTIERAIGSNFRDTIVANDGQNILWGGGGSDNLDGGMGNDKLIGGADSDTASYASAPAGVNVSLDETGWQDTIGAGKDTLTEIENLAGSSFADTLVGNAMANRLEGLAGNDTLRGGEGTDRLVGGKGKDRLTGGAGRDTFIFDAALDRVNNVDRIADFVAADDTIQLQSGIFSGLPLGFLQSSALFFGSKAHDGSDRILYEPVTGGLFYDADGKGGAAAVKFGSLEPGLALTESDFKVG